VKIKDISVHLVKALWRNFIIVKLTADDGTVGYGEATLADFEKTVEAAILDYRPHLIGREMDIPAVLKFLEHNFFWHGGGMLMAARSAIEQSMWDALGKSAGLPVYRMLGGKSVDRVRTYVNGFISGSASPEEYGVAASRVAKLGFTAMKFDPFGSSGPGITIEEMRLAMKRVEAIRNAVGENIDILIEAHGRFDPDSAIRVAKELEVYSPFWFEEPIREDNIKAMAEVRSRSPVTIAAGERLVTKYSFNDFLAARAAAIVQPDVCHIGGIRAICEIATMAEANYVSVAPHNANGPIATAASLNAIVTMQNGLILEYWIEADSVRRDLMKGQFDLRDGYLYPSEKPGLGIEVNEEAFAKYPYTKLHYDVYDKEMKYHDSKP
jgi:galactonate dehydratase